MSAIKGTHHYNNGICEITCFENEVPEGFVKGRLKSVFDKMALTNIERYGVPIAAKNSNVKKKQKRTCVEKYGGNSPTNDVNVRKKQSQTCLEKYGVDNIAKSKEFQEAKKQICFEKYGVSCIQKTEWVRRKESDTVLNKTDKEKQEIVSKHRQTCINKYGVDSYSKTQQFRDTMSIYMKSISDEVQRKVRETMHKNNSFATSKPEEVFYNELLNFYDKNDIEKNYWSEKYPFKCDFYIKSTDTFIELNYHQSHGPHPFDSNNKDDIELVDKWKSKIKDRVNSKGKIVPNQYKSYVNNFTIKDPQKLITAISNKLHYIMYYKDVVLEYKNGELISQKKTS